MKLVFLHIEKSAGTSQRDFFKKVFGEDSVFWWGLNSDTRSRIFDPSHIDNEIVIGGHRDRSYYDEFTAIYSSIVREPVSRVLSLFNYFIMNHLDEWEERGLDRDSILNTLNNCPNFVQMIENGQCRFISGERSFSKVKESFEKEQYFVGSFDYLSLYNQTFCECIGTPILSLDKHNVGPPGYEKSIELNEESMEKLNTLLAEDYKLYDFINKDCKGLFNSVHSASWNGLALESKDKKASVYVKNAELKIDGYISIAVYELSPGFITDSMHVGLQCFSGKDVLYENRVPLGKSKGKNGVYHTALKLPPFPLSKLSKISIGVVDVSQRRWLFNDVRFSEIDLG